MKNLDNVTNVWGKVDERRHEVLEVSVQGMRNRWPLGFPLVKFRNAAGEEYAHSFEDDMQSNKVRVELNDRDVKRAGVCVMTVEWHEKGRVVASRECMGLIEGKKMEKPKYEAIGGEEDCAGGNGGGSGLPEGGEPFKQLVTDASGNTAWEDRLAYKTGATYAYDGVLDGKDTFTWDGTFVKISDDLPTEEQLAIMHAYNNGNVSFQGMSLAEMPHFSNETVWHDRLFGGICICYSTHIVVSNGSEYDVPSTGVYINVNGFDWMTLKWGSIKPIDPPLIGGWKALGEGEPVKTAIAENVSFTLVDMGSGLYAQTNLFDITPVAGQTYLVTWDGVEYECVAYDLADFPGVAIIGNATLGGSNGGNGEPFMILNMEAVMVAGQDANTHTLSVYVIEPQIIPVPSEYLPLATEEAQGAIKVYNFPAYIVSADEMNAAVEEMNAGSARVFWAGAEVRNASVNGDVLTCNLGEEWRKTYTASSGKYSASLWEYVATPACVNDFYMVNGSGKKFRITVQDDGTLTATEVT